MTWRVEHAQLNKQKIVVTSLIFKYFCFDYYSYRFGLDFLGFIMKCLHARNVRQAFSLYLLPNDEIILVVN